MIAAMRPMIPGNAIYTSMIAMQPCSVTKQFGTRVPFEKIHKKFIQT